MKDDPSDKTVVCRNRRARRNYRVEDTLEAGLVLEGTEVKSLRQGKADLKDSYAVTRDGEMFLVGSHIASYDRATHFNHEPTRERGYTLVPLEIYFKSGWAKVLLGLAKGRRQYDHREAIRAKEERREMRRASDEERSR